MSTERTSSPTTTHGTDAAPVTPPPGAAEATCACWSRRQSLAAAGVAVAGTAGLTACGSGTTAEGVVSSAASAAASAAGEAIKAAEVPVGGGIVLDALKVVVTQPTAGDFKAFSAVCPHQGCTVGSVTDGLITCPCHGSQFDIATGAVKTGPATSGLEAKSVSVGADGIQVS